MAPSTEGVNFQSGGISSPQCDPGQYNTDPQLHLSFTVPLDAHGNGTLQLSQDLPLQDPNFSDNGLSNNSVCSSVDAAQEHVDVSISVQRGQ